MKPAATIRRTLPILLFTATACRQIACFDTVDLSTMQGNDSATVVLNGRRAACEPYEVVHGSPKALVANFLASTGCASEAAAFAKANAMGLKDTVGTWTDSAGDVAAVVMQAPLVIPLNILIMSGDLQSRSAPLRIAEAQSNVSAASQLFDDNQCGITFSIAALKDERRGNFTPDLLTADCALPGNVARFKAVDAAMTAVSGINVFYYEGSYGTLGQTCADGSSAVILLAKWSSDETLAHELGHALSLEHTNGMAAMPADDLMMSPTAFPASLTIGQCFRTNVETASTLNTLGIRTGATRACATATCPPLSIHK